MRDHPYLRVTSALLLALTLGLTACSPSQSVYSMHPVDTRGNDLPFERASGIELEDGSKIYATSSERFKLEDDRIVLEGEGGGSWPIASVKHVDWVDAEGDLRRNSLQSPDDLLGYAELPRISSVTMRDGERIDLGADNPHSRWSEDERAIEISFDGISFQELPLIEIETVQLHESQFLESTVLSWKFWAMGAAAGILLAIVLQAQGSESLAVR